MGEWEEGWVDGGMGTCAGGWMVEWVDGRMVGGQTEGLMDATQFLSDLFARYLPHLIRVLHSSADTGRTDKAAGQTGSFLQHFRLPTPLFHAVEGHPAKGHPKQGRPRKVYVQAPRKDILHNSTVRLQHNILQLYVSSATHETGKNKRKTL